MYLLRLFYNLAEDHQTGCSHWSWQPNNDCINLFLKKKMFGSFWILRWNALTMHSGHIYNVLALQLDGQLKSWFYSAYITPVTWNYGNKSVIPIYIVDSTACTMMYMDSSDDYGSWNIVRLKLKEEFTFMTVLNIPSFLLLFISGKII